MAELRPGDQKRPTEALLAGVMAPQHGVFSRSQALAAGLTDTMIATRTASGLWVRRHAGVYALAGVPSSWEQRLMAACLGAGRGAVVSHRSAAALWKLDGCDPGPVEVTVGLEGTHRLTGVTVRHTRALPVADRGVVDGIPVTRVARTVIDLAAVLDEERLEWALNAAVREHLVSVGHLERRLAALGTRGRPGVPVLRDLLAGLRRTKAADSRKELALSRLLVAAGLPPPVRQFELHDQAGLAARFDLAYPERRIGIEFDSYRHHFGRQAWRRDQSRHNRATAAGWLVFHITDESAGVAGIVGAYRERRAA